LALLKRLRGHRHIAIDGCAHGTPRWRALRSLSGDHVGRDRPRCSAEAKEREAVPPLWLMRQAGRYLPEYRALREKAAGFLDLAKRAAEITLQMSRPAADPAAPAQSCHRPVQAPHDRPMLVVFAVPPDPSAHQAAVLRLRQRSRADRAHRIAASKPKRRITPLDGVGTGGPGNGYQTAPAFPRPRLNHEYSALHCHVVGGTSGFDSRDVDWFRVRKTDQLLRRGLEAAISQRVAFLALDQHPSAPGRGQPG
jgi:hypothetical protein